MRKQITKMLTLTVLLTLFGLQGVAQQSIHGTLNGTLKNTMEQTALRNGPVIYTQYHPLATGYIQSCDYTDEANLTYSSFAADDFIIPEDESWDIRYINFAGFYFNWTGSTIDGFNVYIYENDDGKPGDIIHTYENHTVYNEIALDNMNKMFHYELMLPSTLSLSSGHYWLTVQAITDMSLTDAWGWMNHEGETIENEYHWKNPKGGFHNGADTEWTPASDLMILRNFNLAFALMGEGLENDLSMISIDAPTTSENLTENEIITISFKNEGLTTITEEYQASYSISGAEPIIETVSIEIEPNEIVQYSFTTPADLSVAGPYTITATITLAGDPVESNNTISKSFYNYGEVYTMPATGTEEITTCGATFTDSGGLYGDFDRDDDGILTIHPSVEGDRIRLTFLEFNASHGGFKVYDGVDTDATFLGEWKGTNSPGVLTALNSTGALTIHFKGPGWEEKPGWIAFISCVTPVEDDFAMLEFTSSLATIFENNTTTLSATIQNFGSEAFDKTVTFTANDEVIGTAQTGLLSTAEIADLSIEWTPTVSNHYVLTASLPEDDGTEENNSLSLEKFVYPFNAFFQDFEDAVYPPEGWSGWGRESGGYSGNYCATIRFPRGLVDSLLPPRIHVKEDAELSFYAVSNGWWPGDVEVYWKEEGTDEWIFLICPELELMQFTKVTIDMSDYANKIGRIAFIPVINDPIANVGKVSIDYILGQNITYFHEDNDLKLKEFSGDILSNFGDESEFTVLVRNNGLEAVTSDDYTVKLIAGKDDPIVLKTVEGVPLSLYEEAEFTITHTFTELGEQVVTAIVDFEDDNHAEDNTTDYMVCTILPIASELSTPYESSGHSEYPMDMHYNHSLTETIYLGEDIGQEGIIFGLAWEYRSFDALTDIPVRIWLGITDQESLFGDNPWIPADQLIQVFDGTLDLEKGEQTIYIPFTTPINYNDSTKNIAIMVEKSTEDYVEDMVIGTRFKRALGGLSSKRFTSYSIPGDPYDPQGNNSAMFGPYTHFIFNENLGSMEGSVTEVDGTAIEGASVTIDQLRITTTTNAQGVYELPYLPAGTYTATADAFGYVATTEDAEITLNETTTLDFTIGEQALVSVSGKVTGADNPGVGIEDAEVKLEGYYDYSVHTNAQGEFLIENVYSEKSYELSVKFDGFATHVATVAVQEEDMVIDDIVLSEAMLIPFAVVAETKREEIEDMMISWETPTATAQQVLVYDDNVFDNGWAAEVGEEVWMGNLLPFEVPTTVSGFDLYWVKYTNTSTQQPMRLDIFNAEGELVVSSEEFMSQFDAWIHVEVPNMTLIGDHYAMVYWYGTPEISTFLGWTEDNASTEYARYLYPGGQFTPLSNLINDKGTFMIRPHAMFKDDKRDGEKALTGYDIRFGKLIDLENASTWTKLNTSAITENSFEHTDWTPANDGKYLYAVQAFYTTGESELSFSNIVDYKKPEGIDTDAFDAISIYPNPAVEYVTIANSEGANLILFGMDGSVKLKTQVTSNNFNLNISDMASGSYLLVIQTNEFVKQFKLIVK